MSLKPVLPGGLVQVPPTISGVLNLKGSTNCSANPNYPSATKGDMYYVSTAGKIGGASGTTVGIGDSYTALADNAGGTQASVGSSWFILVQELPGWGEIDGTLSDQTDLQSALDAAVHKSAVNETIAGHKEFKNEGTTETYLTVTGTSVTEDESTKKAVLEINGTIGSGWIGMIGDRPVAGVTFGSDDSSIGLVQIFKGLTIQNNGSYVNIGGDNVGFELFGSTRLLSLTSNGFVKTSGGNGALSVDTASYQPAVGTTAGGNATAGNVGEYVSASVVQGSATALTSATPKTVTSISLTAGDWDVTGIGSITGASTGTEFDVAIGTTTNSMTGTVLGDTRCQTPTVSLAGADATLMIPAVRVSISSTTTYYLIVQETFTIGTPAAYGRISARRVR
jgi:hypothetical protein